VTLAFIDTETTSLRHDRRIWNIGLILRNPDGSEVAEEIIVRWPDMANADPMALKIGRFWERHPLHGGDLGKAELVGSEADAAYWVLQKLRPRVTDSGVVDVHIVGCVPSFDVFGFLGMFRRNQLCWPAHYRPICAETLAVGALAARGLIVQPGWKSDELSERMGLNPLAYDRHTALGDAMWARDLYDAAMRPLR